MTKPNAFEQLTLELINQARLNPAGEYDRWVTNATPEIQNALDYFNVDLDDLRQQFDALTAAAPLAWNDALGDAALTHSGTMRQYDQQSHRVTNSSGNYVEPALDGRLTAAGYNFSYAGENVFAFATSAEYGHAGFFIDWGNTPNGIQNPAGHRNSIMNNTFTEVGVGHLTDNDPSTNVGPNLITQNFGTRNGYTSQITGVVFNDADGDRFYDIGEGVGNTTIASGALETKNFATGGYKLDVSAGTHTLVFSGTLGTAAISVILGSQNIKVDLVDPGFFRSSVSATLGTGAVGVELLGQADINATGNNSANTLIGNMADNILNGSGGDDRLFGRAGEDTLSGGSSDDRLEGGDDNDWLDGGSSNDTLLGGDGRDMLVGGTGNDTIYGESGADTLDGGDGDDYLSAGSSNDILRGGAGKDTLKGSTGNDDLYGDSSADILEGGDNDDYLNGGSSGDTLRGGTGEDILTGGTGNDKLFGDSGSDLIYGGVGADALSGGSAADRFVYKTLSDSDYSLSGRDTIFDFSRSDRDVIDLSALDANANASGNQTFSFIGSSGFTGTAGQLRFSQTSSGTTVFADIDGDRISDFAINFDDTLSFQNSDFLL